MVEKLAWTAKLALEEKATWAVKAAQVAQVKKLTWAVKAVQVAQEEKIKWKDEKGERPLLT